MLDFQSFADKTFNSFPFFKIILRFRGAGSNCENGNMRQRKQMELLVTTCHVTRTFAHEVTERTSYLKSCPNIVLKIHFKHIFFLFLLTVFLYSFRFCLDSQRGLLPFISSSDLFLSTLQFFVCEGFLHVCGAVVSRDHYIPL